MRCNHKTLDQRVRENLLSIRRPIRQVHMSVLMAEFESVTIKAPCKYQWDKEIDAVANNFLKCTLCNSARTGVALFSGNSPSKYSCYIFMLLYTSILFQSEIYF